MAYPPSRKCSLPLSWRRRGPDYEKGVDSGKVQLGLELKDLMVANNRKGPVSENNLAHEYMLKVDHNDVRPDEGGEVPGGDVG